jgi:hypothetical protein
MGIEDVEPAHQQHQKTQGVDPVGDAYRPFVTVKGVMRT